MPGPGGLLPGGSAWGGCSWSGGVSASGGVPGPGGSAPWVPGPGGGCGPREGAWRRPPGQLLLRAVRMLLECILVKSPFIRTSAFVLASKLIIIVNDGTNINAKKRSGAIPCVCVSIAQEQTLRVNKSLHRSNGLRSFWQAAELELK